MSLLTRAENYCYKRGDKVQFRKIYTEHRRYCSVKNSVFKTLCYLYGPDVAYDMENNCVRQPSVLEY